VVCRQTSACALASVWGLVCFMCYLFGHQCCQLLLVASVCEQGRCVFGLLYFSASLRDSSHFLL
jgi:hypothetical protein